MTSSFYPGKNLGACATTVALGSTNTPSKSSTVGWSASRPRFYPLGCDRWIYQGYTLEWTTPARELPSAPMCVQDVVWFAPVKLMSFQASHMRAEFWFRIAYPGLAY